MGNIFVYCELDDDNKIADVSLELLTKGKELAKQLNCYVETVVIGKDLEGIEEELFSYGANYVYIAEDKKLVHYQTLVHACIVTHLLQEIKPQIGLFGATSIGRDLAPRVASALKCGLTADCTDLQIGDYVNKRTGKEYKDILYQIRPAFGGNIIATIVNPETRPQLATVRDGVMKKNKFYDPKEEHIKKNIDTHSILKPEHFIVEIIDRAVEKRKIDLKNAKIIVSGGYGVGSRENFKLLFELASVLGAEVGASRAAVDSGFAEKDRQIGQTGVTVRPKLYIACGISGQVQHRAGMEKSSMIISINTDPNAPINKIADYAIIGDLKTIIPKMIEYYKKNIK